MKRFRGSTIEGRIERGLIEDFDFASCTFDNCSIGDRGHPADRVTVRNVVMEKITQRACSIDGAIIEDVRLRDLNRLGNGPLFFWASVFKHVTLSGKLSGIKINGVLKPGGGRSQAAWDEANKEYYRNVDWALDISKAEFQGSISFEAVPGSLVRRDEETQVVVSRDRLARSDWRSLDYGKSAFKICIEWFLADSQYDDVVLVAPKKSKKFKEDLEALAMLRREGIAM